MDQRASGPEGTSEGVNSPASLLRREMASAGKSNSPLLGLYERINREAEDERHQIRNITWAE